MSIGGTAAYDGIDDLPEMVAAAVDLARRLEFPASCRPEQGRLLRTLAAGVCGWIGETGTGCGVGLAWMLTGRRPGTSIVTVERDAHRARHVKELFAGVPDLDIVHGDWTAVGDWAPYGLLVLDGGGNGKTGERADPARLLISGGTVVIDDFTPMTVWPPQHDGVVDDVRLGWLEHPALLAAELRLAPDLSTIVGTRRPEPSSVKAWRGSGYR